ncbi:efflux RND transporter periplasmic adaptor subunit [Bacillus kexueae]|uniref:efflux RND transporter periplasmic adaptor subunit n=1 Tax=Aeribacillus kexueae TaxID=2078952 RepID=UPI001FAF998E|nr:efflux RND transporter periplasmic adaptor subunit [Bacillus kexueae]
MKTKIIRILIAIGMLGLLLANVWIVSDEGFITKSVMITSVVNPEKKDLKKTLETDGVVVPSYTYYIPFNRQKGDSYTLVVQEGDLVEEEEPLIEYHNDKLEGEIEFLEKQKEELETTLSQVQAEMLELESNISAISLEEEQELTYILEKLDFQNALTQKVIEEQQVANRLLDINKKLEENYLIKEDLVVKSKGNGIVTFENQLATNDGEPVLTIKGVGPLWVKGSLTENNITKVEEGMKTQVSVKALNGHLFEGVLTKIERTPEKIEGDSTYSIYVELLEENEKIYEGFHSTLSIYLEEKQDVLAIPISSVQESEDQDIVFVLENGRIKKQPIQLGLQESKYVEAAQGITKEDTIVKMPIDKIEEGQYYYMPIKLKYIQPESFQSFNREEVLRLFVKGLLSET